MLLQLNYFIETILIINRPRAIAFPLKALNKDFKMNIESNKRNVPKSLKYKRTAFTIRIHLKQEIEFCAQLRFYNCKFYLNPSK